MYSTYPSSPPRPLPRVRLSNKEKGLYSNLFSRADPEGANKVEGRTAVEFFKKSGLPVDRLKEIWNLAAPNGESYLDRERFYVAVRLIALAQAGKSMSFEAIEQNVEVDLPQFSGFGGADKPENDSYDLSPEERTRYEQLFASSAGSKASLNGLEARALFERTGVEIGALSKIWTLADPQDTGVLTKSQFVVAMHLIYKARQRFRVPDQLPASLVPLVAVGSPPEKGTEGGKGLLDIGGFAEMPREVPSFPKPVLDRSPLPQPAVSFPAPELRTVTPPPRPAPDFYAPKPANDDPFAALPKAEVRRDPPPRPVEDSVPKDYFSSSKPSLPKEDRRPTEDLSIRELQRALKTMELQVGELTEELRSTKKEVRTTREASGQELEDFAKEMRKQRDSMEHQIEELTKELRAEKRNATDTCEATKLAVKQVAEAVGGFGILKAHCEDTLKQSQLLAAQMQTTLQQISAQQSKLVATVMELVQKQTAEVASLVKEHRSEVRRLPESRVEKSIGETTRTQEQERIPVEPVKTHDTAPVTKPSEPKRVLLPPESTRPTEPIKSDFRLPKLEERKELPKPDDIDWPDDSKQPDPPKKEDDFEFDIEPKVIAQPPPEPFKPMTQFNPPDFSLKDSPIPDFNFGFPISTPIKAEESAKPDFAAFSFDFPGLPAKPETSAKQADSTEAAKPPAQESDFGDFKAFDAFSSGFSANFSSGVFNFDTSSVQLKKTVFDL